VSSIANWATPSPFEGATSLPNQFRLNREGRSIFLLFVTRQDGWLSSTFELF
jgi:hypothetical protein